MKRLGNPLLMQKPYTPKLKQFLYLSYPTQPITELYSSSGGQATEQWVRLGPGWQLPAFRPKLICSIASPHDC